ncbi:YegP family protein [Aquimarina sp. U1-2]|uniref:YegP family protein n=1 Tax=Aquimarina sp. U1-2 TaxID=2823141 RepID=UPI001AEC9636|nr:YegP family protein [Aquimarina sp. U1-2]MBP2832746.1 YegP family protein [Aquimarina sp. U1-2]
MFELKNKGGSDYHFTLKAKNGQVILSSETYTSKSAAENGIASIKKNATEDARYERKTAKNGKFFFNLKAGNGQVIGSSQMYASESGMENGINSVKENAPGADTKEE